MTENELVESLRRLDGDNRAAKDALVKDVIRESRALARSLVAHTQDRDPTVAKNANSLLTYMEDIVEIPLLEAPEPPAPRDRVYRMTDIVENELQVREKISVRLVKMLDDKAPVPYEINPRVEEKPAPRRVCDEAYILLRKLLNATEDPSDQVSSTRFFLFMPDERKDAEIRNFKETRTFSPLP